MNDRDLRNALRKLPPFAAGQGFTRQVLARLDRPSRPLPGDPRFPSLLWAAATVTVLALGLGTFVVSRLPGTTAGRTEVAVLREESRRIQGEIRELRDRLAEEPAVLYLGGTEGLDLVLDVSWLAELDGNGSESPFARDPDRPARPGGLL